MAPSDSRTPGRRATRLSKSRRLVFTVLLVVTSVVISFVVAELFLRIVPIPGIEFNLSEYDDLVGHGSHPNATLRYQGGGRVVHRTVNRWGYLDRDYKSERGSVDTRIGFFGDSYTEARQVPLEETFFRLVEDSLVRHNVETLAFGVSGFGTLQSYLTSTKWIDYFDIDLVVYVFVENDVGDQVKELKKQPIPYPVLADSGVRIDNSFRAANERRQRLFYLAGDYLTSRSLVLSTISQRLRLLFAYGTKLNVTAADRSMSTNAASQNVQDRIPNENDPPSLWPQHLRGSATRLAEATLLEWRDYVQGRSKNFVILYVPRASELKKRAEEQDSWRGWLEQFCLRQKIVFIDSTPELLRSESAGNEVFFDHFTTFGHVAFANAFTSWFESNGPH